MKSSLPSNIRLGEVKLKVRDLERLVAFYTDVIGLKVLNREEGSASLTADGVRPLLALEVVPDAVTLPERSATGLYHFAILVPDRKQLGVSLRRLAEKRIPIGQADHLVSEALYLSDPEGNGIEIYRDRPRAEWKMEGDNVKMASDPLDIEGILREAEGAEWNGLPPATVMGHVHLHVADLAKARTFYCDVLGFDMMADWSRMRALFVSAGGYHHHLGLNVWAGVGAPQPPANATGLAYYKILVRTAADLDDVVERLRRASVLVSEVADGTRAMLDPFGIEIRLGVEA